MKSFRSVYCVAAVLALAPIGVRALTWQKSRPQEVDPSVAKSGQTLFMHQWTPVDPSLPPVVRPSLQQVVSLAGREKHCLPFPRGVSISQRNTPALFGAKLIDELPERDIIAGERRQWLKAGMASAEAENAPVGRALRLTDGRFGRFGWKAQTASLADFVQEAYA